MAARKTSRSSAIRRTKAADKKTRTTGNNKATARTLMHEDEGIHSGVENPPAILREQRGLFADLYNFAPVAFLTFNPYGIVTELNLTAACLLQRLRQQILGAPLALCLERRSLDAFLNHLERCKAGEGRVVTELEVSRPDGQITPVQLITTPLPFCPRYRLTLYQGVLVDLTAQKALEDSLRDHSERFHMALRCAQAGYWSIELANHRVTWSPEFYELLGLDPDRVLPSIETFLDLFVPADRTKAEHALETALAGESEHFQGEYRLRKRGSRGRWVGMFGRVVRSNRGRPIRISGIGIDVTTQKEAEEILRKGREALEQRVKRRTADLQMAKGILEQEIAERKLLEQQILEIGESERRRMGQDLHDGLGQQITGIIFHAHLLQKQLTNKGLKEAETAQQIVSLLNEAKIQARHIARGLQPVDPAPNGLMAGLDHFATTTSELYHIECRFICPEPVMISEHSMAVHLFRITQEAVSNAFRHGGAQTIEIHLRKTDDELVLEVIDHGRGLPKGTGRHDGLGLRFMRYRTETIGGAFDIRRRPGGGTMVRCRVRNDPLRHDT